MGYVGPSLVAELTTVGTLVGRIGPQSGWLLPAGGLGHSLTGCMVRNVAGASWLVGRLGPGLAGRCVRGDPEAGADLLVGGVGPQVG